MNLHILTTPMEEVSRSTYDEPRWCFHCRARQVFAYVVESPICVTGNETGCWYGPTHYVECTVCRTPDGDCFPGTSREWSDD